MATIRFHAVVDQEQVIRPPAGIALPEGAIEVTVRHIGPRRHLKLTRWHLRDTGSLRRSRLNKLLQISLVIWRSTMTIMPVGNHCRDRSVRYVWC
jgi:hypothetical protein